MRTEIAPGAFLTAVHTDKFKTNCLSVNFLCPLDANASAYALTPEILRRGTRGYPDIECLSQALYGLYGAYIEPYVRKKGETLAAGFVLNCIRDEYALKDGDVLRRTMAILSEILNEPLRENGLLLASYTAQERKNLTDKIEAQINDKRQYAMTRMHELMCAGEAFAISEHGSIERARVLEPVSVTKTYEDMLANAAIEFFYAGAYDRDRISAYCAELLSGMKRERARTPETVVKNTVYAVKEIFEETPATQGKLSMGFRTGVTAQDEDYPAMLIANALFGAGTMSKLFMHVREELSLCYYASSQLEAAKGIMSVNSGIENEKFDVVREQILKQLSDVKTGVFSQDELDAARKTVVENLKFMGDSQLRMEDFYLSRAVAGVRGDADALMRAVCEAKRDEITKAAQKITLDTVYFLEGKEA